MKYIANPVEVDAYVILQTKYYPEQNPNFELFLENGEIVQTTPEMCSRMVPKPGDYWVIQSDGYVYLNPKEVFERKYRPVSIPRKSVSLDLEAYQ